MFGFSGLSGKLRLKFKERFETEDDDDYISGPFEKDKMYLYEGFPDQKSLFRNSIRSLVAEYILENMDARSEEEITEEEKLKKWNLSWFIHEGIIDDSFILHDESSEDPFELRNESYLNERIKELKWRKLQGTTKDKKQSTRGQTGSSRNGNDSSAPIDLSSDSDSEQANGKAASGSQTTQQKKDDKFYYDARKDLHFRWVTPKMKLLPLFRIRNYFGEKIALYFAWTETMILSLWIPAILGIIVFIYGMVRSIENYVDLRDDNSTNSTLSVTEILEVVNTSVDNELTPYYSLMICLWATIFLEHIVPEDNLLTGQRLLFHQNSQNIPPVQDIGVQGKAGTS
ncbi:uncharacterized protein LOC134856143 [Symsagittifera roscoffensis]|uniref:uncharacterized protein LOC134856143 n=1 Tax=Symsagittifera roscoffensis TaxID=84072 RepID=UPI00307C3FB0